MSYNLRKKTTTKKATPTITTPTQISMVNGDGL